MSPLVLLFGCAGSSRAGSQCPQQALFFNRAGGRQPVAVYPYTLDVLKWALTIAASSGGCFDISVGAELVEWQLLPQPAGAASSSRRPKGSWRDIELRPDGRVEFHRPLWIDLGGIAKGYAVDRATERLREWGAAQAVVNAGGDMRVLRLSLDSPGGGVNALPDEISARQVRSDRP